jgi:hypothetical protein
MEDSTKEHFASITGVLNTADEKSRPEDDVGGGGGGTASTQARLEQEGSIRQGTCITSTPITKC